MFIEPPTDSEDIKDLLDWCQKLQQKLLEDDLKGSATWNPGALVADEDAGTHIATTDVTVTGAALGDYAVASFSLDVTDLQMDAQVTAANVVTVTLTNLTDGAVNLAEGTVYVRVFKRTT